MNDHKKILDDHQQLGILLRDLRTVSNWNPDLLRESKVRQKLAGDLHSLQVRLRQHFSVEESDNYLEEISSRKPAARANLRSLHDEHGMILSLLSGLESACLGKDHGAGTPHAIQQRLGQLLDMLKLHERRETALIEEVFGH